mmetsp:Transcript_4243/g.8639  ORF Transcript_4243/g.8639 Transcript_4243/m.8639 type:complete len:225 (+) Transcript_4243:126-800(+)|eukprot:scaffold2519_cov168-Amphora_coffeaeformis.AAC.20
MKLFRRSPRSLIRASSLIKAVDDELSIDSLNSTVTVEQKTKDSRKSKRGGRRRVQFDDKIVSHRNIQMDREEVRELWCTGADMKQYKAQTAFLAKEINRAEKANVAPFSYHRVVLGVYDACCRVQTETTNSPLTETERKHFDKWMEVSISRIGLERICIREMAQDKYARRAHVVDAVLEVQDHLVPGIREGDELMREAAVAISRASRIFAQELAKAQAAANMQE